MSHPDKISIRRFIMHRAYNYKVIVFILIFAHGGTALAQCDCEELFCSPGHQPCADTEVMSLNETVVTLMDEVANMSIDLATANATITARDATIATHETTITAQTATITGLETDLATANGTIATQAETISGLQSTVGTLQFKLKIETSIWGFAENYDVFEDQIYYSSSEQSVSLFPGQGAVVYQKQMDTYNTLFCREFWFWTWPLPHFSTHNVTVTPTSYDYFSNTLDVVLKIDSGRNFCHFPAIHDSGSYQSSLKLEVGKENVFVSDPKYSYYWFKISFLP